METFETQDLKITKSEKVLKWAQDHPNDWKIVCGIISTGTKNNQRILDMLKISGLVELSEMMNSRIYQYMLDDNF